MASIILKNTNQSSPYLHANIDLKSKSCTLNEPFGTISLSELHDIKSFEHPLLAYTPQFQHSTQYEFEYDDMETQLQAPTFVYGTLLNTDFPEDGCFIIHPSERFRAQQMQGKIHIGCNKYKMATETINIQQLQAIITQYKPYQFTYFDQIMIDEVICLNDLPDNVNAEGLSQCNNELPFPDTTTLFEQLELRYVAPNIGFGVFCRQTIPKGISVGLYSGTKRLRNSSYSEYAFSPEDDCLDLRTDGRERGNITRFINHAPMHNSTEHNSSKKTVLRANLNIKRGVINGLTTFQYIANRDIHPGEQLLVDYGPYYPTMNFDLIDKPCKIRFAFTNVNTTLHLKIMRSLANYGIKEARRFFIWRWIGMISTLGVFLYILNRI